MGISYNQRLKIETTDKIASGRQESYVTACIEASSYFTTNSCLPAVSSMARPAPALPGKVSVAVLLAGTVTS